MNKERHIIDTIFFLNKSNDISYMPFFVTEMYELLSGKNILKDKDELYLEIFDYYLEQEKKNSFFIKDYYLSDINSLFLNTLLQNNNFLTKKSNFPPFFYDVNTGVFFYGLNQIVASQIFGNNSSPELIDTSSILFSGNSFLKDVKKCLIYKNKEKKIRYYYRICDLQNVNIDKIECKEIKKCNRDEMIVGINNYYDDLYLSLKNYFYCSIKNTPYIPNTWSKDSFFYLAKFIIDDPLFIAKIARLSFYQITGIK